MRVLERTDGGTRAGRRSAKATARALKPLRRDGWEVLLDLQHNYGNIDHVVVGPAGVFLFDSLWADGEAVVSADGLKVRRSQDRANAYLHHERLGERMRRASADLHRRLDGTSRITDSVNAVVVVHGRFNGPETVDGVTYVRGDQLEAYLREQPRVLPDDRVRQIAAVIFCAYPDPRDDDRPVIAPDPALRRREADQPAANIF